MAQNTVSEILNRWPDRKAILEDAREVDEDLAQVAVHRWVSRSSIPGKYWSALCRGAARRGIEVTPEQLMAAHDPTAPAARAAE